MKKVYVIKQSEIDSIKNLTGSILQTIEAAKKGKMSELQALDVIKTAVITLESELDHS